MSKKEVDLPYLSDWTVVRNKKMTFTFQVHKEHRANLKIAMCSAEDPSIGPVPLQIDFDFDTEKMVVKEVKDDCTLSSKTFSTCCDGDIPIEKGTHIVLTIIKMEGPWELRFPKANVTKKVALDNLSFEDIAHLYITGDAVDVETPKTA